MENQGITMFYELCRLCLNRPGHNLMFVDDLPNEIFSCTGVRVTKGDNLPQKICTNCLDIVQKAKELRLLATSNDNHLKFLFEEDCNNINEIPETVAEEVTLTEYVTEEQNDKEDCYPNLVIDEMTPIYTQSSSKNLTVRKDLFNSSPMKEKSRNKDDLHKNIKKGYLKPSASTDHHKKVRKKSTEHEEYQCEEKSRNKDGLHKNIKKEYSKPSASTDHHKKVPKKSTEHEKYQCEVCEKTFEVYKKFYLHQRSHNKKLFCPIDVCGKSFASRGDLMKHVRVHTGEKPFSCDLCDKKFTQNVTLKQHKESVHSFVV